MGIEMASALVFEPIITSPPDPRRFLRKGTGSLVTGAGSRPKQPPKSAGPRRVPDEDPVRPKPSRFRQLYQRCDLPIAVEQDHPGRIGLRWKQPVECVDVVSLLPLFLEGLIEEQVRRLDEGVHRRADVGPGHANARGFYVVLDTMSRCVFGYF